MRADPHELVRPPMICSGGDSLSTIWKDDILRSAARERRIPGESWRLRLSPCCSGVVVPAKEAAEATLLLLYGAVKLVHAEGFVEVNTGGAERKEARQRNSATHSLSMGECLVPLATCWRTAAVRVKISIYQHG
ncbi:hypothetical protein BHE74_00008460 [Ensete ventricosum]|nr:hypothetical protein BHE74_00008460 [Ensete ventricosum]